MVPEVAAGQAGWFPPPHRNIMTPPATLLGAKCRWDRVRGDERPENVNENVIVSWIVISKAAVPALLIGGTSFPPARLAEKRSVWELPMVAASRFVITAAIAKNRIFLVFIIVFLLFEARSAGRSL